MIGQRIVRVETIDSTNNLAASIGEDGLVVVADLQTAGRGQYGRNWQSEPGDSLLMSVVVKPSLEIARPAILIAWAAVAVSEAIRQMIGIHPRIKWPNDLLVGGKKICGILTEAHGATTIVGIGLNLNQSAARFVAADLPDATSLSIIRHQLFHRDDVLTSVIQQLDASWQQLASGQSLELESKWAEQIGLAGWPVQIEQFDTSILNGRLIAISFDGLEMVTDEVHVEMIRPEVVKSLRAL